MAAAHPTHKAVGCERGRAIRHNQSQSVAISRNQSQSVAIRRNQTQSDAIGRNRAPSIAIGGTSEALSVGVVSGNQGVNQWLSS